MKKLKFNELPLSPEMQRAIADMGFMEATQIQAETIPLLMTGDDVVGQAHTGTGKTAAFGIPMLERMPAGERAVSSVVMCPTRELAIQVAKEIRSLAKYKPGISVLPVYGGEAIVNQIRELRRGVQIIVGTPGRIMDHLERKTLSFAKVRMVVLDEADEMLNMGFRDDIENMLKLMPSDRQTVLFSATMPKPILDIAKRHQNNPTLIKVTTDNLTASGIEQVYYDIGHGSKTSVMNSLMEVHGLKLALVFCNTKRRVDELVKNLRLQGLKANGIHGDLSQAQRNAVLTGFRKGELKILVATDVAARGIDVHNVDAVFNFDIPLDPEYYVHRIGRTGRAGKTGKAFSFVSGRDEFRRLKLIENYARIRIERRDVPSQKEVLDITKVKLLTKLKETIAESDIVKYEAMVKEYCTEGITLHYLAAALLKLVLPPEEKKQVYEPRREERHYERRDERNDYGRNDRNNGNYNRNERRESNFNRFGKRPRVHRAY